MSIDYDHTANQHGLVGPRIALEQLFTEIAVGSVLDVGCGTGTWLRAALDLGVPDVFGIDGVDIRPNELLFPRDRFRCVDLTRALDLGRRFDLALCLEVGEHLDIQHASRLVESLTARADTIMFSGACPGQPGQHHVNCQWPAWWQELFNERGYACDDSIRWAIWDDVRIEPWYRQNVFIAYRDQLQASHEPRLKSLLHPELVPFVVRNYAISEAESGCRPLSWHFRTLTRAISSKVARRLGVIPGESSTRIRSGHPNGW